jgi:L-alanine-DL-glutamate epimerase-like enolase superfamily enzyme
VEPAISAFKSGIADEIVGADPLAPERLYERLFALTSQRKAYESGWSRDALIKITAAVDIACWDIVGKQLAYHCTSCLAAIEIQYRAM